MSELYHRRYPYLRQSPLVHSFNEPLPSCDVPLAVASPMMVALCGNVNASCDDAAARLGEAIATCPNTQLVIYSGTAPHHLKAVGLLREGVRQFTLPRDRLLSQLGKADILVLPHGFTGTRSPEEYQTIFPTKTIEYLISGRPISHSPAGCFLTRLPAEERMHVDRRQTQRQCVA